MDIHASTEIADLRPTFDRLRAAQQRRVPDYAQRRDDLQRLRAAFNPLGIANPGKMFPGSEAPSLSHVGLHPLEKAGVISRE